MPRLARTLATVGGIGELPAAPGTAGSAVGLLLGLLWPSGVAVAALFVIGVWASADTARRLRRHDPSCVVIDECVGMWGVLAVMPQVRSSVVLALLAFGLFRFFDIRKPAIVRRLERLPDGWGIMLDDVGAAACTAAILWGALWIHGRI